MAYLISSLVGLVIGPLLFVVLHRRHIPQLVLDGFVLIAVVGLVFLHVLPEAFRVIGPLALLAALAGLLLPLMAEKVRALSHDASHGVVLLLALLGLLLHAALDGVGLNGSDGLGMAVVVHRIPVGLAVWWFVRPQFGRPWAVAVLAAIGGATIAGWAAQSAWIAPSGLAWVQVVQALVAGSLLHVLLHQSVGFHDHAPAGGWRIPGAVGAVAGLLVVSLTPDGHDHALGPQLAHTAALLAPAIFVVLAVALAAGRSHAWRVFNTVMPWATAAITLVAMSHHAHDSLGPLDVVLAAAVGLLVLLSVAHQGPRDFVLKVLPLQLLTEHHEHHDHSHHHGRVGEGHV